MRVLRVLFRILVGMLAVIGLVTLLFTIGLGTIGWRLAMEDAPEVPSEAVLVLDLRHGVVERAPTSFFGDLNGEIVLHRAIAAIDAAAKDSRVTALAAFDLARRSLTRSAYVSAKRCWSR